MPTEFQGEPKATAGDKFAIVVARFNDNITAKLLAGARTTLHEAGVAERDIHVAWVPGAFELPLTAQVMAESGYYAAVICLGAVIRGETTHDQHINRAVSVGLTQASLASRIPVLFGVLTCDTMEQAIHRSGGTVGNKGVDCAAAALEMADLLRRLPGRKR